MESLDCYFVTVVVEFLSRMGLERDPIKCNRITLQIPLIVAQSFGEPLTLRRIAL